MPKENRSDGKIKLGRTRLQPEDRLRELTHVAAQVLLENGYARTTMDLVAEEARVSRATIYHYFDAKDGLVSSVLDLITESWVKATQWEGELENDAEDYIYQMCRSIAQNLSQPETLNLMRLFIEVKRVRPELVELRRHVASPHTLRQIETHLALLEDRGLLRVHRKRDAALNLLAVISMPSWRILLGYESEGSSLSAEMENALRQAAASFCKAHAP